MISSPNAVYAVQSAAAALGLTLPFLFSGPKALGSSPHEVTALTKVTPQHKAKVTGCLYMTGAPGTKKLRDYQQMAAQTSVALPGPRVPSTNNTFCNAFQSFLPCMTICPPFLRQLLNVFFSTIEADPSRQHSTDRHPLGVKDHVYSSPKCQGQGQCLPVALLSEPVPVHYVG